MTAMARTEDPQHKIRSFYRRMADDPHHRFRSWEEALLADKNTASLQLGFYLASWGMYRGSIFLLQHAYTIHEPVVEVLASPRFAELWECEVSSESPDSRLVPLILDAVGKVKEAYAPFGPATDTLATKVLLGTMGCVPACDRFFVDGFIMARVECVLLMEHIEERVATCSPGRASVASKASWGSGAAVATWRRVGQPPG